MATTKKAGHKTKAELARMRKRLKAEVAALKKRRPKYPGELAKLEAAHARLTEAVNEVCGFLARLGI